MMSSTGADPYGWGVETLYSIYKIKLCLYDVYLLKLSSVTQIKGLTQWIRDFNNYHNVSRTILHNNFFISLFSFEKFNNKSWYRLKILFQWKTLLLLGSTWALFFSIFFLFMLFFHLNFHLFKFIRYIILFLCFILLISIADFIFM